MTRHHAPVVRVVVHGATGRMGREALRALDGAPDAEPVAGVCRHPSGQTLEIPGSGRPIPLYRDLGQALEATGARVVVDFSSPEGALAAARTALPRRVPLVSGTTGLSPAQLEEIGALARDNGVGAVVAPNFALGAVLLQHLAGLAARFFDYAEVIEAHHEAKADAPSGTALAIARALLRGRGRPFNRPRPHREPVAGARGGELEGVGLHAIRMPGLLAHHTVVLGAPGQTLTLRHDTISRECFMPGVLLAVRRVVELQGLVVGLEPLLDLA